MRTYQTHGLPHTDKSCSEVVTVHFICMLAGSEIVPWALSNYYACIEKMGTWIQSGLGILGYCAIKAPKCEWVWVVDEGGCGCKDEPLNPNWVDFVIIFFLHYHLLNKYEIEVRSAWEKGIKYTKWLIKGEGFSLLIICLSPQRHCVERTFSPSSSWEEL